MPGRLFGNGWISFRVRLRRTLLGEMVKAGNQRSKGRAAARGTIRGALGTLSAIFTTAEEDGLVLVNPTRRLGTQVAPTAADSVLRSRCSTVASWPAC
jgi:hypothetical protein